MVDVRHPKLRILVGAISFSDAAAALRLIERLPQLWFSGLGGLLIEDPGTVLAYQFPHKRIVSPSGNTRLVPSVSEAQLLLQADAKAFRDAGSRTAKSANAGWTFAHGQGDLVATALHAAQTWDILLMGYNPVQKQIGKVILLSDHSVVGGAMDAVSEGLCRACSCDRVILSAGAAASDRAARSYQFETLDDCIRTLGRMNGLVVLVDLAHGPVNTVHDLTRVLEAARCPVMVFSASSAQAKLEHSTQIPDPDSRARRDIP